MNDHPYLGVRLYRRGRPAIMGESYTGHGPDDPSGHYFVYEDQPHVTHWVSVGAFPILFSQEPRDADNPNAKAESPA